jgi:hypothetical protein
MSIGHFRERRLADALVISMQQAGAGHKHFTNE